MNTSPARSKARRQDAGVPFALRYAIGLRRIHHFSDYKYRRCGYATALRHPCLCALLRAGRRIRRSIVGNDQKRYHSPCTHKIPYSANHITAWRYVNYDGMARENRFSISDFVGNVPPWHSAFGYPPCGQHKNRYASSTYSYPICVLAAQVERLNAERHGGHSIKWSHVSIPPIGKNKIVFLPHSTNSDLLLIPHRLGC